MTLTPLSIHTQPLQRFSDINVAQFVALCQQRGAVYNATTLNNIANSLNKWGRVFAEDTHSTAGQMLHETGFFTFTGDVRPGQYNFAGLGATGGVPGNSYPSVDTGVCAVFVHRAAYYRGDPANWPANIQPYASLDKRIGAVVAGGLAIDLEDLNGRWARPGTDYADQIVAHSNLVQATERFNSVTLRVALAAGHRNSSGGNSREQKWTGPLTKSYMDMGRRFGCDMRTYTPNDGLGMYPDDLATGASTLNTWAAAGWIADYYSELHFQGLNEGSNAGRGIFCIYPDWDNDVDVDVRDIFRPRWLAHVAPLTGMPGYGDGGMSEKRTGVGLSGYRLGIFRVTEPLKATTTRMIIEHGSHTSPADREIILGGKNKNPDIDMPTQNWMDQCAYSFFRTIYEMAGLPVPFEFGQGTPPTPPPYEPEPNVAGQVGNFYLVESFYTEWQNTKKPEAIWGYPTSGMVVAPVNGVMRNVQFFERGTMGRYDEGTPDGVPVSHPFHVRNLMPIEREEAKIYAVQNKLIDPGLVK
jgi:hypothetical protein